MNKDFSDFVPGRDSLQRMLDAAVWAPNHRLTNPLAILRAGEGREQTG